MKEYKTHIEKAGQSPPERKIFNYLSFFGFTDEPFRLTPDRDFFFPSRNHMTIIEVIRYGLDQGEGFIIVTGEIGTGKSMLLRYLMGEIGRKHETALLLSPQLSPNQLLQAILSDIGLKQKQGSVSSPDNLLRILNDYLFELSKKNRRLVIVIDEAQNLPEESIEQLRLLSNFESDKQKWLQIILVGQPELKKKLEQPSLRQLLQRVTIMENLNPLSFHEMTQYIHFRLRKSGRPDIMLSRNESRSLWAYTGGVPRLINKLMNRALLVAYANSVQRIDHRFIKEAATSLSMEKNSGFLGWNNVFISMAKSPDGRTMPVKSKGWICYWMIIAALTLLTGFFASRKFMM